MAYPIVISMQYQSLILVDIETLPLQTAGHIDELSQQGMNFAVIGKIPAKQPSFLNWKENNRLTHNHIVNAVRQHNAKHYPQSTDLSEWMNRMIIPVRLTEHSPFTRQIQREMSDGSRIHFVCNSTNSWQLVAELKKTGKPLILLLSNGRPLELNRLEKSSDAMLEIWQPGIAGGKPVVGILSGRINPSGKLAITFPYATGQIPVYYNMRPSGRPSQGKYQDIPAAPLYEFAHGLSYTTFQYGEIKASAEQVKPGDKLIVEIPVTNTGGRDGAETVHWFITDPVCSISLASGKRAEIF